MDKAGESNVRSAHVRHTGRPADTANAALKNRLVRRPATTMDRVVCAVGVSTVDASRNDSHLAPVRAEMDDTQVIQSPRKFWFTYTAEATQEKPRRCAAACGGTSLLCFRCCDPTSSFVLPSSIVILLPLASHPPRSTRT